MIWTKIYGHTIDACGRCVHYGSVLDVVANRCGKCGKLYACYKCHDEMEEHAFSPVGEDEPESVMCGVCGKLFSYAEYSRMERCPNCTAGFNARCALHKECYVRTGTPD